MKSKSCSRSIVSVIEPTLTSHRSFHDPAVMTAHFCAWSSGLTPKRFAISVATSTSNPFQVLVCTSYHDCGLYFGSVAIRRVPLLQSEARASVPLVSTVAHTPVPPDGLLPPVLPPVLPELDALSLLAHAAPTRANTVSSSTNERRRILRTVPPSGGDPKGPLLSVELYEGDSRRAMQPAGRNRS